MWKASTLLPWKDRASNPCRDVGRMFENVSTDATAHRLLSLMDKKISSQVENILQKLLELNALKQATEMTLHGVKHLEGDSFLMHFYSS